VASPNGRPAYSVADFARFCKTLILENGKPLKLERFQQLMLADYFSGVTELVIVIPKKNGKTTLLAALALYHLLRIPDAECVIAASSRDQARILFKQAAGLVRRSGLEHSFDVKGGYGEIRRAGFEKDGPRVRVMSADAGTGDGVIPTLALVDELHRHPSGDLYGVFRDGLGPRDGRMITISTAGATLDSPLGVLRALAHELPSFERDHEAKHNYAVSGDGSFVMHEWCLAADEDVDDLEIVAKANPASWQTIAGLRRRHDSPSMTPWQWRRFACGVWTEGEEPWINPADWDGIADPALELDPLASTWLGVDVGVRHDSTGIAIVQEQGDRLVVEARILRPSERNGALPLALIEENIRELCDQLTVLGVAYDPWSFRRSAELLEQDDIPVVEFPQSPERMANASANLFRLVETATLAHRGSPELRAQVMAGVTKETERGWRLVKDPKLSRPIDALIALAMAAFLATAARQESFEPMVAAR
jgi:phage terminase large subunit-like protein